MTKYKPEYCEQLIDHRKKGLSFETFAAMIGVHKGTLYDWAERHPEFLEAKKIAEDQCYLFYNKAGRDGMLGKISGFNVTAWIFTMKNMFGWRDKDHDEDRKDALVVNFSYDPEKK